MRWKVRKQGYHSRVLVNKEGQVHVLGAPILEPIWAVIKSASKRRNENVYQDKDGSTDTDRMMADEQIQYQLIQLCVCDTEMRK